MTEMLLCSYLILRKQSENAPLLTASMRQAKLEDNFSKYKHAVIRFNFPDKMVLQAKFRPRETGE